MSRARAGWAALVGIILALLGTTAARAWPDPATRLMPLRYGQLAGWGGTDLRPAFAAFRAVCARGTAGGPGPSLAAACAAARALPRAPSAAAARRFFEAAFAPAEVVPAGGGQGFFTGYYEPEAPGALRRTARFSAPLLKAPPGLVAVPDGMRLPGVPVALTAVVKGPSGRVAALPDRAAIEAGALAGRGLELVWLDPVDAFFIQVQGSGRVRLADGRVLRVGFAGRNGWPYTAIARLLVERGVMTRAEATAPALRAWLVAHPADAPGLMRENRSYIFFRETAPGAAIAPEGGAHVPLMPGTGIAIDRRIWPYGLPVWIDADLATGPGGALRRFRHLAVAEDAGDAIKGPARADIFFGTGERAGAIAGLVKQPGRFVVLVPRGAAR
ncbi:MAG TPA: MltA domain-containing protein [Hyphomicrobiales bacterium]|nr:MltA domain-containing protein [Hyphomicrobiales bacterium]